MTCTHKLYKSIIVFLWNRKDVYYYNIIIIYIIFLFLFLICISISISYSISICLKGGLKGGFNIKIALSKIVQISIFRQGLDEFRQDFRRDYPPKIWLFTMIKTWCKAHFLTKIYTKFIQLFLWEGIKTLIK